MCGRVCTGWVGLHVIAETINMYYLQITKDFYPHYIALTAEKFKCLYSTFFYSGTHRTREVPDY
jgi:hypothetical protein